jgi:EmrB/QacA subfamily drug resistance transporter
MRDSRTTGRRRSPALILATLCSANVMATMDLFIVNVSLHSIGVGFGGEVLSNVAWVLSAYAIVFGALLVPAGRFADRYGRRSSFLIGLSLFTVASLCCAVSPNLWSLVAFRCVQAAGGAILVPASLGLILVALPSDRVLRGVRIWTVSSAISGAIGPVLGGLLTAASWRWIFVINLPIGIATVIAAARWVPNINHNEETRIPDLIGSVLVIVALGAVSLGLLKGPDWGWSDGKIIACWAAAIAGIGLFLLSTRLATVPVVDLAMFKSRVFSTANVTVVIVAAVLAIQLLGMSLFLEQSWHFSTVVTGLGIAPGPVMVYVGSQVGQRLNQRVPVGTVTSGGFAIIGIGIAIIAVTLPHVHSYPAAVLPGWLLSGFGTGLTLPTIIGSGTADLPPAASATGSAVVNMARQLGYSLGTAILVAILGTTALSGSQNRFLDTLWVAVGACGAGALLAFGLTPRERNLVAVTTEPTRASAPGRAA